MSDQKYNQGILKAQERLALQAAAGSAGQTPVKAQAHSLRFPKTKNKRKRVQIHRKWVTTKACASLVQDVSSAPWHGALMVEQGPVAMAKHSRALVSSVLSHPLPSSTEDLIVAKGFKCQIDKV